MDSKKLEAIKRDVSKDIYQGIEEDTKRMKEVLEKFPLPAPKKRNTCSL